jgi:hypothetical protein
MHDFFEDKITTGGGIIEVPIRVMAIPKSLAA